MISFDDASEVACFERESMEVRVLVLPDGRIDIRAWRYGKMGAPAWPTPHGVRVTCDEIAAIAALLRR